MRTFAKKIMSGMMAAVLAVGMMPASALALTEEEEQQLNGMVGVAETITSDPGEATKDISTVINVRTVGGLGVQTPEDYYYGEEEYSAGDPIAVYISGIGKDTPPAVTWKYAEAQYKGSSSVVDFTKSYAAAKTVDVHYNDDALTYDEEHNVWVATHVPRHEALAPQKTYLYWLDASAGSGVTKSEAQQAADDPYIVVRESGYKAGPYFDGPESEWTWGIAGAGVDAAKMRGADISGMTDLNGAIRIGITLNSDDRLGNKVTNAFNSAAQTAKMASQGAWNVFISDVVPETDNAYNNRILVVMNAQDVEWPEGVTTPKAGTHFELFRMADSSDTTKVTALSADEKASLTYKDGFVMFYLEDDSQATGALGTYCLAVRQSAAEADLAFEVQTEVAASSPVGSGTIDAGGSFAYGAEPTFIFTPQPGYKVDQVQLDIYEKKGDVSAKTVTVKNALAASGDASYGTWQGNFYTFPKEFNKEGKEAYAILRVTFAEIPDNTVETFMPKLTIDSSGNGTVYVAEQTDAGIVNGHRVVAAGTSVGSTPIEKNEVVQLYLVPDAGSQIGTVRVNGEAYEDVSQSFCTPKLAADMTVQVEFVYGGGNNPGTETQYTVSADYDRTMADIGFGTSSDGVVWQSSTKVAAGDPVTMQVRPKAGYELVSAQKLYGSATSGEDVTADVQNGMLTLLNIQRDTRVKFEFRMLSAQVAVGAAPAGGIIALKGGGSAQGTHEVTPASSLKLTITSAAGYELDATSVKVTGETGDVALSVGAATENADGTKSYQVEVTYLQASMAGDGAQLSYAFQKEQTPEGQPNTAAGTVGASEDGKMHGSVASSTVLDPAGDTTIYFYPDATPAPGYRVSYVEVDGVRVTGSDAKPDDRFTVDIISAQPHITFHKATESFAVRVVFEPIPAPGEPDEGENPDAEKPGDIVITTPEQPGNAEGEDKPGGHITPSGSSGSEGDGKVPTYTGPDGGGTTFEYVPDPDEPDGTSWVVDTIVIDGTEILDEWGVELKDKMEGPDANGLLYDPDSDVKYDPTTGEYLFYGPDDKVNRVTVDADTGKVTFNEVYRDLNPEGTFASTTRLTVTVVAKAESSSNGGTIMPTGEGFPWKKKMPLTTIMAPENGKSLRTLSVNGQATAHVEATEGHMDDLQTSMELIERLQAQLVEKGVAVGQMMDLSQLVSLQGAARAVANDRGILDGAVRAMSAPEEAYAAERLTRTEGMRAAVIPGSYFQKAQNLVTIQADFGEESYQVTARVEGGHGTVGGLSSPDAVLTVSGIQPGASYTLNYKAEGSYRVKSVTDNGRAVSGFTQTSYTLSNVQENHNLVVTFESVAAGGAIGPNTPINKALRRMTSLASTGDLAMPGLVLLIGVACGAAGVATIATSRRRRTEAADSE